MTRIILMAVNILLIADVILVTFAGLVMSQFLLELTDTDSLMSFARTSHSDYVQEVADGTKN